MIKLRPFAKVKTVVWNSQFSKTGKWYIADFMLLTILKKFTFYFVCFINVVVQQLLLPRVFQKFVIVFGLIYKLTSCLQFGLNSKVLQMLKTEAVVQNCDLPKFKVHKTIPAMDSYFQ